MLQEQLDNLDISSHLLENLNNLVIDFVKLHGNSKLRLL